MEPKLFIFFKTKNMEVHKLIQLSYMIFKKFQIWLTKSFSPSSAKNLKHTWKNLKLIASERIWSELCASNKNFPLRIWYQTFESCLNFISIQIMTQFHMFWWNGRLLPQKYIDLHTLPNKHFEKLAMKDWKLSFHHLTVTCRFVCSKKKFLWC